MERISSQVRKFEEELKSWRYVHKRELEQGLVGANVSVLPFVSETINTRYTQDSRFFPLCSIEEGLVGMAFPMSRYAILSGNSEGAVEALRKIPYSVKYHKRLLRIEECAKRLKEKFPDQYKY